MRRHIDPLARTTCQLIAMTDARSVPQLAAATLTVMLAARVLAGDSADGRPARPGALRMARAIARLIRDRHRL